MVGGGLVPPPSMPTSFFRFSHQFPFVLIETLDYLIEDVFHFDHVYHADQIISNIFFILFTIDYLGHFESRSIILKCRPY